ncbi:MAG TPA: MFS transporter [Candidatus Dormibacteraeota bacterium]|jgi:MFS family permease|nr:MFS transporter [Candidatus Dormibacteraeota bacterium]
MGEEVATQRQEQAPIDIHEPQRAWRRTLSSLGVPNYRLFFIGQLISVSGTWMQTVAQALLVLHLTGSGTALGFTTAVRFAPMLILAPWGGLIADRLDKRKVLYITQTTSGLLALAFGVLVGTHLIQLWMIYVLAAALGFVNVFDNPARQAFISELVPPSLLRNAVTLNSVTMNLARVFGAAAGGIFVATIGLALCFDLNALSFVAVVITLLLMSAATMYPSAPAPRRKGQVREGLRYVASTPELILPLVMIAIIGTLAWEFQVSLPLIAQFTFHGRAGTYGTMASVMGVGAVVGGLISASRSRPRMVSLSVAAIGWGIAITLAALSPSLLIEYGVLLFVGYGSITFNTVAKTALQLAAVREMRGRVMALWGVAWLGSTPIGAPIVGWVGQEFGPRWSLLIGGVPTLLVGLIAYPMLRAIDRRQQIEP